MKFYTIFAGVLFSNLLYGMNDEYTRTRVEDLADEPYQIKYFKGTTIEAIFELLPRDPEIWKEIAVIDLKNSYKQSKEALLKALAFAFANRDATIRILVDIRGNRLPAVKLPSNTTEIIPEHQYTKKQKKVLAKLLRAMQNRSNADQYITTIDNKLIIGEINSIASSSKPTSSHISTTVKSREKTLEEKLEEAIDTYFKHSDEDNWNQVQQLLGTSEFVPKKSVAIKDGLLNSIMISDMRAFQAFYSLVSPEVHFFNGDNCLHKAIQTLKRLSINKASTANAQEILNLLLETHSELLTIKNNHQISPAAMLGSWFFEEAYNGNINIFNLLYPYINTYFSEYKNKSKVEIAFAIYSGRQNHLGKQNLKTRTLLKATIRSNMEEPEFIKAIFGYSIAQNDEELFNDLLSVVDVQQMRFENNRNALDLALDTYLESDNACEMIELLLKNPYKLRFLLNDNGSTPQDRMVAMLFDSIAKCEIHRFKFLHDHLANPLLTNAHKNTLFHSALLNYSKHGARFFPILQTLFTDTSKINMHTTNNQGQTIISCIKDSFFESARIADVQSFTLFNSILSDLTITDANGNTCLHLVAARLKEAQTTRIQETYEIIDFILGRNQEMLDILNNSQLSPRKMLEGQKLLGAAV